MSVLQSVHGFVCMCFGFKNGVDSYVLQKGSCMKMLHQEKALFCSKILSTFFTQSLKNINIRLLICDCCEVDWTFLSAFCACSGIICRCPFGAIAVDPCKSVAVKKMANLAHRRDSVVFLRSPFLDHDSKLLGYTPNKINNIRQSIF